MATALSAPRYSLDDLETSSIHSAAPSYVSEVPSYHSTAPAVELCPEYAPTISLSTRAERSRAEAPTRRSQQASTGLPPIPSLPNRSAPSLENFARISTWSTINAPAARHYRSVAERRITDGRYQQADMARSPTNAQKVLLNNQRHQPEVIRPLEDPYLVGEAAAAEARRERLARETGNDILIKEDQHWDWLIATMKDWDERERSWANFRRSARCEHSPRSIRRQFSSRYV